MYFDKSNAGFRDSEKLSLSMFNKECHSISMTGDITDRIYDRKGNLIDEIVGHNLVLDSFAGLVMCLIKNQPNYSGLQYWAVGSGLSSWDSDIPEPQKDEVRLTNEIGRVQILPEDISFLDTNFDPTTTPTNIILIKKIFNFDECNGIWREFGLFGGNATSTENSGIMINKRHHAIITKTDDMKVERNLRFTLTLV